MTDTVTTTAGEYPNLATCPAKDLVAFYNTWSGLEPIKRFKTKEEGQQLVGALIAKMEDTSTPEMEKEAEEIAEENQSASSIVSQLVAANTTPTTKSAVKNENVWGNVRILFDQGKTNKETLALIHEMYGNTNTTMACIAWYRNKYKKMGLVNKPRNTELEVKLDNFASDFGLSAECLAVLKSITL